MAHAAIARLLGQGVRRPTTEQLFTAVGREAFSNHPGRRRQPARQALLTATAVYFRLFVLDEDWEFLGAEVAAPNCRLDLVFSHADGRIRADEVKSGRIDDATAYRSLETQLKRQLDAGRRKWGERFVGVRAVLLAAPRQSFLLAADGTRRPIDAEAGDD